MRLSVVLAILLAVNIPLAALAATTPNPLREEVVQKASQANAAYGAGKYKEAEDIYNQAIAVASKSKDLDRERAILLTNLGAVYRVNKQNALSVETYKKSLELKRKLFGDKDSSTTDTMEHLVVALQAAGKQDEAKKLEQEMISAKVLPDVTAFILPAGDGHGKGGSHAGGSHAVGSHAGSSHLAGSNAVSSQTAGSGTGGPQQESTISAQPQQVTQSIRQMFVMSPEDRYKLHNPKFEEHHKMAYDPNSVVYVGGMFGSDQAPPPASQINSTNSVPVYRKETVKVPITQQFDYHDQLRQLHARHPHVSEMSMRAALEDGSTLLELGNRWLIKITQQLDPMYWHGGTRVIVESQLTDRYQVNVENPVAGTLVQGQFMGR